VTRITGFCFDTTEEFGETATLHVKSDGDLLFDGYRTGAKDIRGILPLLDRIYGRRDQHGMAADCSGLAYIAQFIYQDAQNYISLDVGDFGHMRIFGFDAMHGAWHGTHAGGSAQMRLAAVHHGRLLLKAER